MLFHLRGNRRLHKRSAGIVLNVKVSRSRKMRKFFSSSILKKCVVLVSFTAIGVFGVIGSIHGVQSFFRDPRYQVTEISVYNQHFFSQKEVLEMSGLAVGMYPFDFSVRAASREIEKNPNVKRASVERVFPDKVVIKVVERQPVALLHGRKNFLIDEEGVVLPMRNPVSPTLVAITGAQLSEEEVGQKLQAEAVAKMLGLMREYMKSDLPLSLEFAKIDISNPRNLVVVTRQNLKVYFGDGDFARKLAKLTRVLSDLERRGKGAVVVDLRYKDVVVQPLLARAERAVEKPIPSRLPVIHGER